MSAAPCPSPPHWRARSRSSGRRRPLVVAGGGVVYADASAHCASLLLRQAFPWRTRTRARARSIGITRPRWGRSGPPGRRRRMRWLARPDVVPASGRATPTSRLPPRSSPARDVRFVNINTLGSMAMKHGATMVVCRRARGAGGLTAAMSGWSVDAAYRQEAIDLDAAWQREVDACYHRDHEPLPAHRPRSSARSTS